MTAEPQSSLNRPRIGRWLTSWALGLAAVAYLGSGTTVISPGEVAMIQRWGCWIEQDGKVLIAPPGLLFAGPAPMDRVLRVPVKQEQFAEIEIARPSPVAGSTQDPNATASDLSYVTGDQQAVQCLVRLKFRIDDPRQYLSASIAPQELTTRIVRTALSSTLSAWTVDEALRQQRESLLWTPAVVDALRARGQALLDPAVWHDSGLSTFSDQTLRERILAFRRADQPESELHRLLDELSTIESLSVVVQANAQRRLDRLNVGIRISAVEVRSMHPPEAIRAAFLAVQDARIQQETWRQEALGEQAERWIDARGVASQAVGEARGRMASQGARAAAAIAAFEADRQTSQGELGIAAWERMRRDAWEEILAQKCRVLTLPTPLPAGGVQLTLPIPGEGP